MFSISSVLQLIQCLFSFPFPLQPEEEKKTAGLPDKKKISTPT
jgi:hypothetical protein